MSSAPAHTSQRSSYCRCCHNACPIDVTIEDGRAVSITGTPDTPLYAGYTCIKGRAWAEVHYRPDRLLRSQAKQPGGGFAPIAFSDLIEQVADRLRAIVDEHGPNSVALYLGTKAFGNPTTAVLCQPFMSALGSQLSFTANAIDQPGKSVAKGLHGSWFGGPQGFDDADVGLIFGGNPFVSYAGGLPSGNPGRILQGWAERGFTLIVVDPRRTDLAKRASIHLQPRPGQDVSILAGIIRVIIEEELYDKEFVDAEVEGFAALREAVADFDVEFVAEQADIPASDLVEAAREFAGGRRGYAVASTGPNMSGPGTLVEYLVLCLNTICGRWLRSGERVNIPSVVFPIAPPKAQASRRRPAFDLPEPTDHDFHSSLAGLQTASIPDCILDGGDDRIRALIVCGGNPAVAWPDQLKTIAALQSLELLVDIDPQMSQSAEFADFVVAPLMGLEVPSVTHMPEANAHYGAAFSGYSAPWAQWTDAVISPPEDSELVPEWRFFYELAKELGLPLQVPVRGSEPVLVDMTSTPTTEDMIDLACRGSRIPVEQVRAGKSGGLFPEPAVHVLPKDADCETRLDVGSLPMLEDLREVRQQASATSRGDAGVGTARPFRLISRRLQHVYNSSAHGLPSVHRPPYNPAYIHPEDLADLGLKSGDEVLITSDIASIRGIAKGDDTLRRGLVSMSHAYGGRVERDRDFREIGSNTGRLISASEDLDRYTGQPRMSNVAVSVSKALPEN